MARLSALCTELGAPPPRMVVGRAAGYRHRVRLSVRGRVRSPKIGIFREGTHDIVDIPRCVVHHPLINEVTACLKRAIVETRTPPYSDVAHAGIVRAVQVVVERASQTAQIVLVACAEAPDSLAELAQALEGKLGHRLHSLWFNGNPERTNRVLGPVWHKYMGADMVEEAIGGARVFFPPDAFGQANLDLAGAIVEEVHNWIPEDARVLELYAGVGAIGLGLMARGNVVEFNELGSGSLAGLARGIEAQHVARGAGFPLLGAAGDGAPREHTRTKVWAGSAREALLDAPPADVVIVDPPRKGLGSDVCRALCSRAPPELIYVSCGLDSFQRDARELGVDLQLGRVVAYGLFPYTDHVETLASFRSRT